MGEPDISELASTPATESTTSAPGGKAGGRSTAKTTTQLPGGEAGRTPVDYSRATRQGTGAHPASESLRTDLTGGGFVKKGGGKVNKVLARMVEAGKLALTGKQIALLDAVSQVETGGDIGCVQTTDDQVVSVGFKQVVLGHGSLEKIMLKAPAGFAKHGLMLDMSKTYEHPGWDHPPHQIAGVEDEEQLRTPAWGLKFYEASMEPDVVAAMVELALVKIGTVEKETSKQGKGIDLFADPTAQGWLLETLNNRPAFMEKAVERAIAMGAGTLTDRDAFLDVLAAAIVETYVAEEPPLQYRKAKKRLKKAGKTLTAEEDAALRAAKKKSFERIGRKKGRNIIKKIARDLEIPTLKGGGAAAAPEAAAPAAPAAIPQAPAVSDETMASLPDDEPQATEAEEPEPAHPDQPEQPQQQAEGLMKPEHVDAQLAEVAPAAPEVTPDAAPAEEAEAAPEDGLIQGALEAHTDQQDADPKDGGPKDGQKGGDQKQADRTYYRNTRDATSRMEPHVKELYEECVALARQNKLRFPGSKRPEGASSEKFEAFIAALYKQYDYKERRINKEIIARGGKRAYQIKEYLESLQRPIPAKLYRGRPECGRLHHKALDAFLAMQQAAEQDGVSLIIGHGFRPPKNNKPSPNPISKAANSSHSYGLAFDLHLSVDAEHAEGGHALKVREITTKATKEDVGGMNNFMQYYLSAATKWMLVNGRRFEFYPYQVEPWHYEYNPEGMAAEIVAGANAFKK